jgi:hypothetical protein
MRGLAGSVPLSRLRVVVDEIDPTIRHLLHRPAGGEIGSEVSGGRRDGWGEGCSRIGLVVAGERHGDRARGHIVEVRRQRGAAQKSIWSLTSNLRLWRQLWTLQLRGQCAVTPNGCEDIGSVTRHRDAVLIVGLFALLLARDMTHNQGAISCIDTLGDPFAGLLKGGVGYDPVAVEGPWSDAILLLDRRTLAILPNLPDRELCEAMVDRASGGLG